MWILGLLVIAGIAWYLAEQNKPVQRIRKTETTPTPAQPDLTTPALPNGPITTDKDAKAAYAAGLQQRGYRRTSKQVLREMAADLGREMSEHRAELRSSIDYLKEELEKQREYRDDIADELEAAQEDRNPDGSGDEFIAKKQRHLGHLDREIGEMAEKLQADQAALKAFKADRTAFVKAFLAHTLDNQPSPNRARQ